MADIKTMKIDDGNNGFVIINECDFNEKIHKRFEVIKKRIEEPAKHVKPIISDKAGHTDK